MLLPMTMALKATDNRILNFLTAARDYCAALEGAREMTKEEFVATMLMSLPRLYSGISEIGGDELPFEVGEEYYASYVDEDFYNNVRLRAETLLGEDDMYLETFEEDMKYSDTPIAASISEGLADIFQDLYNFTQRVADSDGEALDGAMRECKENFEAYWGQTLCNTLRALHNVRYSHKD